MSQNTLIEKIEKDAAHAVEEIKSRAAAEIDDIKQAVEAEVEELSAQHEATLKKKKAQMKLVAVSKAKQAGNIAVQTAKREQIDVIISAVQESLEKQDSEAYVAFFTKFVKAIVPAGVEVSSVEAPKNRLDETESILKAAGLTGAVSATGGCKAGCIVNTTDGVYDVTLERLLNERRAELEMVIVNKVGA